VPTPLKPVFEPEMFLAEAVLLRPLISLSFDTELLLVLSFEAEVPIAALDNLLGRLGVVVFAKLSVFFSGVALFRPTLLVLVEADDVEVLSFAVEAVLFKPSLDLAYLSTIDVLFAPTPLVLVPPTPLFLLAAVAPAPSLLVTPTPSLEPVVLAYLSLIVYCF